MATKVNTCVYLDREVLENAKKLGLDLSKVSERAFIEAIGRLTGWNRKPASTAERLTRARARPRFEPFWVWKQPAPFWDRQWMDLSPIGC